jgi:hypothetical protein
MTTQYPFPNQNPALNPQQPQQQPAPPQFQATYPQPQTAPAPQQYAPVPQQAPGFMQPGYAPPVPQQQQAPAPAAPQWAPPQPQAPVPAAQWTPPQQQQQAPQVPPAQGGFQGLPPGYAPPQASPQQPQALYVAPGAGEFGDIGSAPDSAGGNYLDAVSDKQSGHHLVKIKGLKYITSTSPDYPAGTKFFIVECEVVQSNVHAVGDTRSWSTNM